MSAEHDRIIQLIARRTAPGLVPPIIASTLAKLQRLLPSAEVMLGGSTAKGTNSKGKTDVDVFVRFPPSTPDERMSAALRTALPKASVVHGSRDYLQFTSSGVLFEIVPVRAITRAEDLLNVTDMSPLHVAYVRERLSDEQRAGVRVAKLFCKAAGVYGAESHIQGVSGYVLELLLIQHTSFMKLVRWLASLPASNPPSSLYCDLAGHYESLAAARAAINESKLLSPLLLVDPLDKTRNAAAALSAESLWLLSRHAKAFLRAPATELFSTQVSLAKVRSAYPTKPVAWVTVRTPKGKSDIVGAQVRARYDTARAQLTEHGFTVLHTEWRFGEEKSVAWFVLAQTTLSAFTTQTGPPLHLTDHCEAFRSEHPNATVRSDRLVARVPRKYTSARALLRDVFAPLQSRIQVSEAHKV